MKDSNVLSFAALALAFRAMQLSSRPGDKGDKGEKGEPGGKGEKGNTGDIGPRGKDVYDYLVENGYEGTEEDFRDGLTDVLAYMESQTGGVIADGETKFVSGGAIYGMLNKVRTPQLFDLNDFLHNTQIGSSDVAVTTAGSGTTQYINIPSGEEFLSFSGLGNSPVRRIAWRDGLNGSGGLLPINSVSSSAGTVPIPAGAKSFRFFFQRPEDGDVSGTFMLNYGAPLSWLAYEYVEKINNLPLYPIPARRIGGVYAELNGTSPTVNASGWYRACPVVEDVAMKGCTGYGYDLKRSLHLVSEYNTTISARLLIFRDSDLVERNLSEPEISTPFRVIDVTTHIDHIQGCCWDLVDDTYLILGTLKGLPTSSANSAIVKVSPIGTIIDIIPLGNNITVQVGMIDILHDGNIGIKPNTGSTLYIFNRAYQLVNRVLLIANEGFCVNKFTGEVWCASDAHVVKKYDKGYIEKATFPYDTFPNESSGSNVEGMAIMPDGSLVICADAFLHGGTALGNCLYFFDFEGTVNKRRYFYLPNGEGDPVAGYTTEIIATPQPVTNVVVSSNYETALSYRANLSREQVANAAFSGSLVNSNFFQVKVK